MLFIISFTELIFKVAPLGPLRELYKSFIIFAISSGSLENGFGLFFQ